MTGGRLDEAALARRCATPRRTAELAAVFGLGLPDLPGRAVTRRTAELAAALGLGLPDLPGRAVTGSAAK